MLLVLLCIAVACVHAQQVSRYSLSEWKHEDGLPSTRIFAIQQTADGFLWLGTADGLVRFDGLQFVQQPLAPNSPQLLGQVVALAASGSGDFFAGTSKGDVVRLNPGKSLAVRVPGQMKSMTIVGGRLLAVDTTEGRWMLSTADLHTLSHEISQGHVDASPWRNGLPKKGRDYKLPMMVKDASAYLVDREGNRWVGTHEHGLYLLPVDGPITHFERSSGLTSENVSALFEDREANVWVATRDGLNRLRQNKFPTIEYTGKAQEELPSSLTASADHVWALSGAFHLRLIGLLGRMINLHHAMQALAGDGVGNAMVATRKALITVSPDGGIADHKALPFPDVHLLASSELGVWLYSPTRGLLRLDAEGSLRSSVSSTTLGCRALQMAAAGQFLWLACTDGTILRVSGVQVTHFALPPSISEPVNQMLPLRDGSIWLATDSGLLFYDGARFRHWDRQLGLPGTRVQWVRRDSAGNLWLGYSIGVARVSEYALLNYTGDAKTPLPVHVFDDSDGIAGTPEVRGASAVAQTSDGALWFTVSGGVAVMDVRHITLNRLPPPVHIVAVTSNGRDLSLKSSLTLPHASGLLEFSFSAPSFTDPRKVEFRYRLENFDNHWQQTRAQRRVSYANLPPGSYRFHVTACNNDGIWNDVGDSVGLTILPAWYQTLLFRTAALLAVLLALGLIYRLRSVRREQTLAIAMDIRVRERTEIARELHDYLIQEILAVSLQLELASATLAADRSPEAFIGRALSLARDALKRGRGGLTTLRNDAISWPAFELDIRQCAKDASHDGTARLSFQTHGMPRSLSAVAGEQISMIMQEALRNALVHTNAEVKIVVDFQTHRFCIGISDEGPGLTAEQTLGDVEGHYGIRGMRERAARIGAKLDRIQQPGSGSEWRLEVPATVAYASNTALDHSLWNRMLAFLKR